MSLSAIVSPGTTARLGVLSNPLSGGNRKGLSSIAAALARHPGTHQAEAATPSEVAEVLREFARREVNLIAVNGGDGTVHAVLTGLFRASTPDPMPMLAVLRAGTASMIGRDAGLAGSPPAALGRLLAWLKEGRTPAVVLQRPVLKVGSESQAEPLYGMFFGAAGICQGIRFCLDRVHSRGVRGELAAGITLASFLIAAMRRNRGVLRPVPAMVTLDGEAAVRQPYLFLLVSTLERLFLGIRPYWASETAPLYYTALAAHPRHLLRALPSVIRGRRSALAVPDHGYYSRKVQHVGLALSGGFTIDGELYGRDDRNERVCIEAGGTIPFLQV